MTAEPLLVHHLIEAHRESDKAAIISGDRSISHRALNAATRGCANALLAAGLERGDRVVIFLPRGIEECWAMFGASRADGVFVPANALLKPQQLGHIIRDCGARIVISCRAFEQQVREALADDGGTTVLFVEDIEAAADASLPAPREACIGEDLAAILYTSGSTGLPKGVMLSHRNLMAGTRIVRTYLGITQDERILSVLPFSFDYGLNQLLTAMEQGATIVILTFRMGDEIVRALRDHAITGLAGVPTVWAILTKGSPLLARTPLPHLRYITNSGGAVPTETVKALRDKLPATRIFLMYGLTEAFRSTYLPPEEIDRRPNSIGRAIPECEVFAVTADGRRARPGEPGILVHRGPTVSLGYWNRPDATAQVLRPNPLRPAVLGGDIVCWSGDLVVEDEDGYFTFVGRNDGMIKTGGYRVSPTEVEEAMMATGAFAQVAVIGLPDALTGQRVHAIAVPLHGGIDAGAILREVGQRIAAYMVPRAIEVVDALPVTPNGKVDYPALKQSRLVDA